MLNGYQSSFVTSMPWNECILVYTQNFPEIILLFVKLHFKAFSRIAIDQAHKQNIAVIKCDIGAIGLTEDKYKMFFLSLTDDTS